VGRPFNPSIKAITMGVEKVLKTVTSRLGCHCKRQGSGGAFGEPNLT
jgi:hypothetical protein